MRGRRKRQSKNDLWTLVTQMGDETQPTGVPTKAHVAGSLLGRYRYVRSVGLGGGGSVHCMEDSVLLRRVAVKMLDPAHLREPRARRFLHEAQITSQLDHPNIVPVHDLAETPPYYTMKLVTGKTLDDLIEESVNTGKADPGSVYELVGILLRVCDALAFAHSRGILHGDLKPANVMVGDYGEVYLMDWGLAKREAETKVQISGPPEPPEPGKMFGTPAYIAPEQLAGAHEKLDRRTDVFGVGGILYQIATGRAPFEADSLKGTLATARAGKIRFVPRDRLRAPAPLRRIVRKALARSPADRYGTIADLKRDLEAFSKGGFQLPTRTYAAGTSIIREGARGKEVFIIESGTCRVTKKSNRGERFLREMGVGGVFGETAALAGGIRTATVTAISEVKVRVVSKKILDEYLGPNTWIKTLVVALAQRFRAADARLAQVENDDR